MRRVDGPGDAPASRSTAATWAASAWSSCRRRFARRGGLVSAIDARDLRRGFTLTLLVLLGAAWLVSLLPLVLHRPPRQPADPAAHRGADRFRRWRLVATAGDGRQPALAQRRSGAGRRRVQPHGRSARGEPRAARAPDADGELAVAGAQDRARAEELADADPPDRRGDAGAAAAGHRARASWTRPSRSSSAKSSRSSGGCGRSPSSRASRRCIPRRSTSTRSSPSAWRCCARRIRDVTYRSRLDDGRPRVHAAPDLVKGS